MKRLYYLLLIPALAAGLFSCSDHSSGGNEPADPRPVSNTPEQQMKEAIAQYPDSLSLRENLAQFYFDAGRLEEGIAIADGVLKKDSMNDRWWDIKAALYAGNDDTTNAIKAWEKAADIRPLPQYLQSLGYLYADTKNEKAIMIADALLVADKAHSEREALLLKGIYYGNVGKTGSALQVFDKILGFDYTYMLAYREKAILLYNNGRYADALAVLQKATTLQNNFDEGYYWMGRCYEKLQKSSEAIESYQTALMYDPNYIEAKDALGRLGVK